MIVELPTLPHGDARVLRDALARAYDIGSDIRMESNRLYMRDTITGEMLELYMDRGTLMIRREGDASEAWPASHGVYGWGGRFSFSSAVINFPGTGQANAQRLPIYDYSDAGIFIERHVNFNTGGNARFWVRNDYRHEISFTMLATMAGTGGQGTDYYVQWRQTNTGDWQSSATGPFGTRGDDIDVMIAFDAVINSPQEPESEVGYELWGWCEERVGSLQVQESSTLIKRA